MAYTAGAASVSVTPDFSGWHRRIGDQLKKSDADFAKAGEKWGSDASKGFGAKFDPKPKVKPELDDKKVKTELEGLGRTRTPAVKPELDDEAAKTGLRELTRTRFATVKVRLSEAKIGESLAGLKFPALGAAAIGLAPTVLGGGFLGAGAGLSLATAGAGISAFAAIAKPEIDKVTKAQKALTAAQQQYAKATTKAGRATALKAEAAATAGLTDSEKRLSAQLVNLQNAWQKVSRAQEPVIGRALTPWLATATEGMRLLPDVVRPAASALTALGGEAKRALTAPFWDTFAKTLGGSSRIAIHGFGDALGHVADGFAHLFVEFAPDINKLPHLIDGWAASFDRWAQHYSRSGLDDFLKKTFSPQNIGSLKGDLKSLGTTFGNLATATANMSPLAFTGLSNVLSLLAKLSPGQIEAIALLYGGIKAGQAAGSLGQGLSGILGLLGGGKKAGAAEKDASGILGRLGKLGTIGKGAGVGAILGLLTADGILHLPGVNSTPKKLAANPKDQAPTVPGLGKLPQSFETPFGMPGPHDPRSANNWLTSWSPYERLFTRTIPGWAKTGWDAVYRFMSSPIPGTNNRWLTSWAPYESFFTRTVPGWGRAAARGLGDAWNASSGWVASQFGKARRWVTGALKGAGSWLHGAGASVARGIGNGFASLSGWVSGVAGRARGWITGRFSGAVGWLRGAGSSVMRGLGNGLAALGGWVRGVAGRAHGWIRGAFGGAGGWLWGIGESIMSGLANGLAAAVGRVRSILSWVTNHIPSWKGPPAYDRVLLRPAGQLIMGGFTDSLAAGIPGVRSVMGQVTAATAGLNVPRISSGALPRVRGGDGAIALTIGASGNDQLLQAIVRSLRADISAKSGGDVQAHLGRGKARV